MNTNPRYKFCVIGGGTIAASILLITLEACKIENSDIDITCIYDASIPAINTDKICSAKLLSLIQYQLNFLFQVDLSKFNGTIKFANKYVNFGDNDFYSSFYTPIFHMDGTKFNEFVFKKIKEIHNDNVTFVHDNVKNIKKGLDCAIVETEDGEVKYDYVFDCRGFPSDEQLKSDDYDCSFESPVNSVLLYSEEKYYNEWYTEYTATIDGWMYGIPLLNHKTFRYVYNNKITSVENATRNFKKLKNIPENVELRSLSWNPFFKKEVCDGNIITVGDSLFFTESSDDFRNHYTLSIVTFFLRTLFTKSKNIEFGYEETIQSKMNSYYTNEIIMRNILRTLLFYQASVNIDSEFWKYARVLSSKGLEKIPKERIKRFYTDSEREWDSEYDIRYLNDFLNGLKIYINDYL
jgi:hypothetical protein